MENMSQKKKAAPSKDHRAEMKRLRTETNRGKRTAKHAKRMTKDAATCPKVQRGTARALRRYCDRTSREFPSVLKGKYTMSMLVRVPKKEREKKAPMPLARINGVEVFSKEHAGYLARELMQQLRQREQQSREMRPAS